MAKSFMKTFFSLLVLVICGFSLPLAADATFSANVTSDEIQRLDTVIEATQRLLEIQTDLKEKLLEFRAIEKKCIQNPKDAALMQKLVVAASETKKLIDEAYLEEYFHNDFLHELTELSKVADKKNIPPA